jgi:hypothetical protein
VVLFLSAVLIITAVKNNSDFVEYQYDKYETANDSVPSITTMCGYAPLLFVNEDVLGEGDEVEHDIYYYYATDPLSAFSSYYQALEDRGFGILNETDEFNETDGTGSVFLVRSINNGGTTVIQLSYNIAECFICISVGETERAITTVTDIPSETSLSTETSQ